MRIGFIGVGAVGGHLAGALTRAGARVAAVTSRRPERARAVAARIPGCEAVTTAQAVTDRCDLVFLTVPDDQIEGVCSSVRWRHGVAAVHCSGALDRSVLASAEAAGALTGSCHPFQPFAREGNPDDHLSGSMFGIEADEPLRSRLGDLVTSIDGWPLNLESGQKTIYHIAAVLAANYLITLAAASIGLLESLGVSSEDATRGVLPILRGSIDNLERHGVPDALAGPIARGDTGTIALHLQSLAEDYPDVLAGYIALGRLTIPIAQARGELSESAARSLQTMFDQHDGR
jgi:predicted short-subunit dehydrogenase-like oxidoreductase (DUF2520 family)